MPDRDQMKRWRGTGRVVSTFGVTVEETTEERARAKIAALYYDDELELDTSQECTIDTLVEESQEPTMTPTRDTLRNTLLGPWGATRIELGAAALVARSGSWDVVGCFGQAVALGLSFDEALARAVSLNRGYRSR